MQTRMDGDVRCETYESLDEMFSITRKARVYGGEWSGIEWAGGRDLPSAIAYVQRGATDKEMEPARKIMEQIDSSFRDREVHAWQPNVLGPRANVGDYLAGKPLNMRKRTPIESDISPMRVVIEPSVSQSVKIETMLRRGAAISALIMRLSEERPVELWASMSDMSFKPHGRNKVSWRVRLDTQPINLSQAVAVLASPSFSRMIAFSHRHAVFNMGTYEGSSWVGGQPGSDTRDRNIRRYLQLEPQDVFIQGGHIADASLMDRDPVQWVHKQLEKQREVQSD